MNPQGKNEKSKASQGPKQRASQTDRQSKTTKDIKEERAAESKNEQSQFKTVKQMIDMHRAFFDGMINSLIKMLEQTAVSFEGATWLPKEGREACRQWVDVNKKACEGLKSAIGSGYSNLEKFLPP